MARCPAALEAAIDDMAVAARGADACNHGFQLGCTGRAAVGADVELRQFAVEQARHMAADRMGVVKNDLAMLRLQSLDLCRDRIVIRAVIEAQPTDDFGLVGRAEAIERVAVEGRRRAELGRRLPRIERGARRIAVHVDHAARDRGRDRRCAQIAREGVKIGDPPVGIELRAPWRDELIIEARKIGAAVREGDDQRGVAAVDAQPVHQPIPGSSAATAAARLPVRISAVAASISGWKCRSSSSVGTTARRCPRAASSAALDVSGAWKSMP